MQSGHNLSDRAFPRTKPADHGFVRNGNAQLLLELHPELHNIKRIPIERVVKVIDKSIRCMNRLGTKTAADSLCNLPP